MNRSKPESDDASNGTLHGPDGSPHAKDSTGTTRHWLRSVVENSTDVVTIVDADGTLRYASPAWQRVLGHDVEAMVGSANVLSYVHPDDLPHIIQETEKALSKGCTTTNKAEYRFRHADGSWRWMESVGTYLLDDPTVGGVVVTSRDITARKEAETRLREAEERYRLLVEAVPAMTYVRKMQAGERATIYVSPQVEDVVGYTPEEYTSIPELWAKILHPEDRERVLAECERKYEAGEPFAMEYRQVHKDNSVVWLRDEATPVRDEEGRPLYWLGVQVDITERGLAQETLRASEERFRSTFEDAPIGVALTGLSSPSPGLDRRYLRVNRALCEMLGYTKEELLTMTSSDVTHPEDLQKSRERLERLLEEGGSKYTLEKRYVRSDGRVVWAMLNVSLIRDSEGRPSHFISQFQDVTERKEMEEALRRSEERYRTVVERQTELVCRFLPDLTLSFVNEAYARYYGREPEELVGRTFLDYVHESDHAYYDDQLVRLSRENPTTTVEERFFAPDGVRWLQWTDTAIFDGEGRIVEYQSVGRDVTERKALEERLEHQAFHDALTSLPNRPLLLDRLDHSLRRNTRQQGRRVAVLLMDLDNFKSVNDSLGHEAGDMLLVAVAGRLGGCLRPGDTLARFGGDEFVVLLEDVGDLGEAVRVKERIAKELEAPFVLLGRGVHVSASIGIALGDDRTESPERLLRDADTAMYEAKSGTVGHRVFDSAMHERVLNRLGLENDLRTAVERGQFQLFYQPKVRLEQEDRISEVEALLRWRHPQRGLMMPGEFIPMAEETGMIVPIGAWVLRETCRQVREWQDRHPSAASLVACVNISAGQLRYPDLLHEVSLALEESGIAARNLVLEITESALAGDMPGNVRTMNALGEMGIRFALDDFGSDYSSLSYLLHLPVDIVKIDRSFVQGLGENPKARNIVEAMISLVHSLGLEAVGEGVETAEQLGYLRSLGCDSVQGYHLARPGPAEILDRLFASRSESTTG